MRYKDLKEARREKDDGLVSYMQLEIRLCTFVHMLRRPRKALRLGCAEEKAKGQNISVVFH